jgi:hypothetical protein
MVLSDRDKLRLQVLAYEKALDQTRVILDEVEAKVEGVT